MIRVLALLPERRPELSSVAERGGRSLFIDGGAIQLLALSLASKYIVRETAGSTVHPHFPHPLPPPKSLSLWFQNVFLGVPNTI